MSVIFLYIHYTKLKNTRKYLDDFLSAVNEQFRNNLVIFRPGRFLLCELLLVTGLTCVLY